MQAQKPQTGVGGHATLTPAVEYIYADDDVNPDNGEIRGGLKVRFNMF